MKVVFIVFVLASVGLTAAAVVQAHEREVSCHGAYTGQFADYVPDARGTETPQEARHDFGGRVTTWVRDRRSEQGPGERQYLAYRGDELLGTSRVLRARPPGSGWLEVYATFC